MPKMEEVCTLPNGYTLFREPNGIGGYTYYSNEINGGVFVWDTSVVDPTTLLTAITENYRKIISEAHRSADNAEPPQQKTASETNPPDSSQASHSHSSIPYPYPPLPKGLFS